LSHNLNYHVTLCSRDEVGEFNRMGCTYATW